MALFSRRRTWGPLNLLIVSADMLVRAGIYVRVLAREPLPYHFGSEGYLIRTSEFAVYMRMVWTEGNRISVGDRCQ